MPKSLYTNIGFMTADGAILNGELLDMLEPYYTGDYLANDLTKMILDVAKELESKHKFKVLAR